MIGKNYRKSRHPTCFRVEERRSISPAGKVMVTEHLVCQIPSLGQQGAQFPVAHIPETAHAAEGGEKVFNAIEIMSPNTAGVTLQPVGPRDISSRTKQDSSSINELYKSVDYLRHWIRRY